MRIGVSLTSGLNAPDAATAAHWMIERAAAAEAAELDLLSVGDRHALAGVYLQNVPMMGRLLANWGPRPAGCLFLLPLWNPLLVAEQVATLAAMAPSTFVIQTGTGGGDDQFAAMGADMATRGKAHGESIHVIKALHAGETVSSELFGLEDAVMGMTPTVPIEWWIGGGAESAVRRAVRHGDVWYAMHWVDGTPDDEEHNRFLAACNDLGRAPRVAVRRDAVILDDGAEARRLGTELLAAGYRGMGRGALVFGSPTDAAEQLAPLPRQGVRGHHPGDGRTAAGRGRDVRQTRRGPPAARLTVGPADRDSGRVPSTLLRCAPPLHRGLTALRGRQTITAIQPESTASTIRTALTVRNLEVVYNDVILVLRGVSLDVPEGSVVAVLGANGAGKTTLLRAVTGLLSAHRGKITKGIVSLLDQDITTANPAKIVSAGLGQVMEGRRIFAELNVDENLKTGAFTVTDRSRESANYERVMDLFPALQDRRKQTAGYLSGGEQQMLAIGRALMADPKVLLLDEPSLGLAPKIVEQVQGVIREINGQGTSVLLVEQNANMALEIAAHGFVMENGKVVKDGPGRDLLEDKDIQEFYLGHGDTGGKSFRDVKSYRRKKSWGG